MLANHNAVERTFGHAFEHRFPSAIKPGPKPHKHLIHRVANWFKTKSSTTTHGRRKGIVGSAIRNCRSAGRLPPHFPSYGTPSVTTNVPARNHMLSRNRTMSASTNVKGIETLSYQRRPVSDPFVF